TLPRARELRAAVKQTYAAQRPSKRHVRFTPNSDRESEIPQKAMSALASKADMCSAQADVRFGPIADILARNSERFIFRQPAQEKAMKGHMLKFLRSFLVVLSVAFSSGFA